MIVKILHQLIGENVHLHHQLTNTLYKHLRSSMVIDKPYLKRI